MSSPARIAVVSALLVLCGCKSDSTSSDEQARQDRARRDPVQQRPERRGTREAPEPAPRRQRSTPPAAKRPKAPTVGQLTGLAAQRMKAAMAARKVAEKTLAGWKYMHDLKFERAKSEFEEITQMPHVLTPSLMSAKDSVRKLEMLISLRKDPELADDFSAKDEIIGKGAKDILDARMKCHKLAYENRVLKLKHKALLAGKSGASILAAAKKDPLTAAGALGYLSALSRDRTEKEEEAWIFANLQFQCVKFTSGDAQRVVTQQVNGANYNLDHMEKQHKNAEMLTDVYKALGDIRTGKTSLSSEQAATAVNQAIANTEHVVRCDVVELLAEKGTEAKGFIPLLSEAMQDKHFSVTNAAAKALTKVCPDNKALVAALVPAVKSSNHEARSVALRVLGDLGAEAKDAVPALIDIIGKANGFEVVALKKIGPAAGEAAPALAYLLLRQHVSNERLIKEALDSIDPAGAASTRAWAKHVREDEKPEIRGRATYMLTFCRKNIDAAAPALMEALKTDTSDKVRRGAARALGKVKVNKDVLAVLRHAIDNDDNAGVRSDALLAWSSLNTDVDETVPALVRALKTEKKMWSVARTAAWCLGELGPDAKAAAPDLLAALKHTEVSIRQTAVEALGKIGAADPDVVKALAGLMDDKDIITKRNAAKALKALGPGAKSAVPDLIKALSNRDDLVARYAAEALGNIGPDAKSAVPALNEAIKNAHPFTKRAIQEALKKIE